MSLQQENAMENKPDHALHWKQVMWYIMGQAILNTSGSSV